MFEGAHNTLLRIIFLTIFLASFAYCFSQIISSFLTFFAYDISTTTKIEIEGKSLNICPNFNH